MPDTISYLLKPLRRLKKRFKVLIRQDMEYFFLLSRGVIHVGASSGQERKLYDRYKYVNESFPAFLCR